MSSFNDEQILLAHANVLDALSVIPFNLSFPVFCIGTYRGRLHAEDHNWSKMAVACCSWLHFQTSELNVGNCVCIT